MNGTLYPGPRCNVQALSLTFDHRNRTICFIHQQNKTGGAKLSCAKIDDLSVYWDLPSPTFYPLLGFAFNISSEIFLNILYAFSIILSLLFCSYYTRGIRLDIRQLVLRR